MVTVTVRIENHAFCRGTGRIPNDNAGEHRTCSTCAGHGWRKTNGGAYKTQQNMLAGRAKRTAEMCLSCSGKGYRVVPDDGPCYGPCTDGKIVAEAHVGDVLPGEISWDRSIPKPVMATLAAELEIVVSAQNRQSTWNEAHLGLGCLWSVTDYGRTWDRLVVAAREDGPEPGVAHLHAVVEAIREETREKLATESVQWIKLMDRDTRVLTDRVVVLLHRGGYSLISQPSIDSGDRAALPPTYTAELLNQEVR